MEIKRMDYNFSVCKVADYSLVKLDSEYSFIGKTDEEKVPGMYNRRCAIQCNGKRGWLDGVSDSRSFGFFDDWDTV